ncbi:MAG TPA: valine--tRNA ligase [Chitinophagaceae bacterium]|nr:valine--tRNA ligase [Chitinophagaceae bacterium]
MELSRNFDHSYSEQKWYSHWLEKRYFHSTPDQREPYTVVIPPPNVTGVLHMGHCLNNTIQDILVRRARMQGKNACWVPGTDHASIATEAKVVQMLRERGIAKSQLGREEFLGYAWEWKEKYGGIILQQLRKLGCSLDWDRTAFTMDPDYYRSVIRVFVDLYNKGYIYRGKRMINWDPRARTALSDEEVIRRPTQQQLYYLRYQLEGPDGKPLPLDGGASNSIVIATVRPETIMGDTAICVHPGDERYRHLHGRFAYVPLINRRIPIITDEYVTMDFGTGALKVTPAHDMNDYQLGQKHGLETVDVLNEDGTLSEAAQIYVGEDRFAARKKIVRDLAERGHLVRTEDYQSEVGYSERTDSVVEPRLSLQWWVDMKKLAGPALNAVVDGDIRFHPAKFRNLYRHWMENIKDWCISRQLWWGHRIPAWYDARGNYVVAASEEEAIQVYQYKFGQLPDPGSPLVQDEDCLDTWFSSWLWPFEVFKGLSHPGNADVRYYYPTSTLVTAPEIIFFWVARMIMAGFEYMKELPFRDVYFTGIVRDKQGRKMSKSLGNSPDLLALIDQYGADAVRFGILIASPAGNDLLWDESSNEQGSHFINKIWNALKLVRSWEPRVRPSDPGAGGDLPFAVRWFEQRLRQARSDLDGLFAEFRLSEALKLVYSLIWDDFCSWYLEWVKPGQDQPVDEPVYRHTLDYFEQLMQLLHPFMPFLTEEVYHSLRQRPDGDDLTIRPFPAAAAPDTGLLAEGERLKEIISALRDARNKNQIKPREVVQLYVQAGGGPSLEPIRAILLKQVNAGTLSLVNTPVPHTFAVVVGRDKFYLETESAIDPVSQRQQLEKDLDYLKGFLLSVDKKLSNERFIQNAKPEIIALEQKKKADAEARIKIIEESLAAL